MRGIFSDAFAAISYSPMPVPIVSIGQFFEMIFHAIHIDPCIYGCPMLIRLSHAVLASPRAGCGGGDEDDGDGNAKGCWSVRIRAPFWMAKGESAMAARKIYLFTSVISTIMSVVYIDPGIEMYDML